MPREKNLSGFKKQGPKRYNLPKQMTSEHNLHGHLSIAEKLRKSSWWEAQIQKGLCHFCQQSVGADNLTMDHLVPVARGGKSTRGNLVPACPACNKKKQLDTPVETILDQLKTKLVDIHER